MNKNTDKDQISFTAKLKNALKELSIPFVIFEAWKDEVKSLSVHKNLQGIIFSGSKVKLSKDLNHPIVKKNMDLLKKYSEIPILGICFGCQVMTHYYHGVHMDIGNYFIEKLPIQTKEIELFETWAMEDKKQAQFYFSDYPEHSSSLNKKAIAWMKLDDTTLQCGWKYNKYHYGILFHPEAMKSSYPILSQFAKLCFHS